LIVIQRVILQDGAGGHIGGRTRPAAPNASVRPSGFGGDLLPDLGEQSGFADGSPHRPCISEACQDGDFGWLFCGRV